MKKYLVYDLPTRVFHWLFAALFLSAYLVAENVDKKSPLFFNHMLIGILLFSLVLFRIVWGLFGTPYAQFKSFILSPTALINYFKEILFSKTKLFIGHNPATSAVAIIMMTCALTLGVSGYMIGQKIKIFKSIHETAATLFLVSAILHILGIIFHSFKHKDSIALSMLSGFKNTTEEAKKVEQRQMVALFLILSVGIFAIYLYKNLDIVTHTVNIFGAEIKLGKD